MGRTNKERYDQALDYIKKQVDPGLAIKIDAKANAKKESLGKAISLAFDGFDKIGTPQQHMALRALLLCQQLYLKPPESANDYAKNGKEAKTYFKLKTEDDIKKAIKSYMILSPKPSRFDFADTALKITDTNGSFDAFSRTRDDTAFGGVTNCYGAVKIWLFNSGLCSLPWYAKEGETLNAYTVNAIIGNGDIVDENDIDNIPKGYVFNIHDSADPNICHWGVSLGDSYAAASNTTAGAMGKKGPIFVDFRKGNTVYGEFKLRSSVEVCKLTYTSKKVVVRALDPTNSANYY